MRPLNGSGGLDSTDSRASARYFANSPDATICIILRKKTSLNLLPVSLFNYFLGYGWLRILDENSKTRCDYRIWCLSMQLSHQELTFCLFSASNSISSAGISLFPRYRKSHPLVVLCRSRGTRVHRLSGPFCCRCMHIWNCIPSRGIGINQESLEQEN